MTTLSGLAKKDWTYQCHVIIREFFENPKHRVLCIYYEVTNKVPMALLSFPLTPVYELCYFIRKPDQIFRLENFHDTIVFGSFNWSVEYYILNVVQSVLTPIIFKIETLPDSILSLLFYLLVYLFFLWINLQSFRWWLTRAMGDSENLWNVETRRMNRFDVRMKKGREGEREWVRERKKFSIESFTILQRTTRATWKFN